MSAMRNMAILLAAAGLALAAACDRSPQALQDGLPAARAPDGAALFARLARDPSFFPIGVWLQSPQRLDQYRSIGVNLFVGTNGELTAEDLERFGNAGVFVIADRTEGFPLSRAEGVVLGWRVPGEPDNAQKQADGRWGACVAPAQLLTQYRELKALDRRPVFLNFGRGVAQLGWNGRGSCTGNAETYYPDGARGGDIVSFDIYPVASASGRLELVAEGVRNLVRWSRQSDPRRPVWNYIEAAPILGGAVPTPAQLRSEVWLSIINGSRGILYFPWRVSDHGERVREDALFGYPELVAAVRTINHEVRSLAPVINRGRRLAGLTVTSSTGAPVSAVALQYRRSIYLFAALERPVPATVSFAAPWLRAKKVVRTAGDAVASGDGGFADSFDGYGVRLYRIDGIDAARR